jgi:parallel beta-helix repeat protein
MTPNDREIWNYTTGGQVWSSPAVADGKVYVGSHDNKTYCLDASTGVHIWNYTTGFFVRSSPAVADGMVFVGSHDNTVYAFGNVIRVPEDYPTIQEAIDAADPGATIIIAPGTYNESIIIDKPLTIIGGKGSSTDFAGGGSGIAVTILPEASGTIVTNIVITNWDQGIFIDNASECKIYDNTMYLMGDSGIVIDGDNASNNLVYSNTICSNNIAIDLAESSTGNIIYANTISDNDIGINLLHSSGNTIYWNSFVNNLNHVNASNPSSNTWDNGYPSGGNYWSDYTGKDVKSGPNQDQPGSDGIGDTPYDISDSEQDNYPLMSPHEYWSNPALGDINKDAKVDDKDLLQLAAAYGSTPEKSNWNLNCDLNRDCKIEALDLFYLGKTYGKNEP